MLMRLLCITYYLCFTDVFDGVSHAGNSGLETEGAEKAFTFQTFTHRFKVRAVANRVLCPHDSEYELN